MRMKKFIITVDTEGDNLWSWKNGNHTITTNNTRYLQRFQDLCNTYRFQPVWLSNYEMLCDDEFVSFAKKVEAENQGEIGMHLHAWNSPPQYDLPEEQKGAAYLIEYPLDVMEEKIQYMTSLIKEKIGVSPVSHRAGRWAMNQSYFDLLIKYGYVVDCSVTPHINWNNAPGQTRNFYGSDYTKCPEIPYDVKTKYGKTIFEVPVTIRKSHQFFWPETPSFKELAKSVWRCVHGKNIWIRPERDNLKQMLYLLNKIEKSDSEYAMFMIHSSELMPGGSPTFQTQESIEKLYADLEVLFSEASQHFEGITLRDFAKEKGLL